MQQDLFIEKIVKRKRRGIDIVIAAALIFLAILLILLCFYIPIIIQQNILYISTLASAGIVYLVFRLIKGLNREYEYSILNDELTIDKIIAERKRVNVFKGSCKDFSVFAPADKLTADTFAQKNLLHFDLRSGQDNGCDWYFISKTNPPTLVLFEPDERFIAAVKRFNPRAFMNN